MAWDDGRATASAFGPVPERGYANATRSGARIEPVQVELAQSLLERFGSRLGAVEVALGATVDGDELIGVAAFGTSEHGGAAAVVAVVPDRRRVGVGSDLLDALVAAASSHRIPFLTVRYDKANVAADGFTRASDQVVAYRTLDGVVTVAVRTRR